MSVPIPSPAAAHSLHSAHTHSLHSLHSAAPHCSISSIHLRPCDIIYPVYMSANYERSTSNLRYQLGIPHESKLTLIRTRRKSYVCAHVNEVTASLGTCPQRLTTRLPRQASWSPATEGAGVSAAAVAVSHHSLEHDQWSPDNMQVWVGTSWRWGGDGDRVEMESGWGWRWEGNGDGKGMGTEWRWGWRWEGNGDGKGMGTEWRWGWRWEGNGDRDGDGDGAWALTELGKGKHGS